MTDTEKSVLYLALAQILNNQTLIMTRKQDDLIHAAADTNRQIVSMLQKLLEGLR